MCFFVYIFVDHRALQVRTPSVPKHRSSDLSALNAGYELAIASYGTGALTISDGGAVSVGSKAYIGFYADSIGTLTIGAAAEEAAAGAGAFDAATLGFRAGEDRKSTRLNSSH